MQQEQGAIKAVGKLSHDGFWAWMENKYKEGWEIYSCYEAGASGYWLHRELSLLVELNLFILNRADKIN